MRPRLLLVLLSLALAAMSIAPAAATPGQVTGDATGDTGMDTKEDCDRPVAVTDGTPVLLGSLLDRVGERLPTRTAALPLGLGACRGVRPGAPVLSDVGLCTFNYLFQGTDGRQYMGTAGHCILGTSVGESTWAAGTGPEARDGSGTRVGEFAYAVFGGVRDFALIRLDRGVAANPQMCYFGGPTGINNDLIAAPVVVQHFGQGVLFGQTVPGRTSVALTSTDPDQLFASGLAIFGDSGGAVNSLDGRAMGVLVTVGLHLQALPNVGLIGITRLSPQLTQAERALGIGLQLRTAPRL